MLAARVVEESEPHRHRLSSGPALQGRRKPSEALLSSALLSSRPKKLVLEISERTDKLLVELNVILIQRIARGYICRRALKIDRLVGVIKEQLGASFAMTILEEVVLLNAFEIATNERAARVSEKEISESLDKELTSIYENLLREQLPLEIKEVVHLSVQENVQDFIQKRKEKHEIANPLLRLIHDLTEEALLGMTRAVVAEVVNEWVDDHLMTMRCSVAFDTILHELVEQTVADNFMALSEDVEVELAAESTLHESVDELIADFVDVILGTRR